MFGRVEFFQMTNFFPLIPFRNVFLTKTENIIDENKHGKHRRDGYSEDHIKMYWVKPQDESVTISDEIDLASFKIGNLEVRERPQPLSSGIYSRLILTLTLERAIGFYMIQIYLPSMLVVVISWVSFWVTRESAPARVTLGVTTVLTITTLITTTNRAMPPVSYIKAVDIYLSVCYFFVFAALLEFALVSYSGKRKKDALKRKAASSQPDQATHSLIPSTSNNNDPSLLPDILNVHTGGGMRGAVTETSFIYHRRQPRPVPEPTSPEFPSCTCHHEDDYCLSNNRRFFQSLISGIGSHNRRYPSQQSSSLLISCCSCLCCNKRKNGTSRRRGINYQFGVFNAIYWVVFLIKQNIARQPTPVEEG